jgi:hypothetical protein
MAHFAQLNENNEVIQVIVVSNDDILNSNGNEVEEVGINFCKSLFGEDTIWKQTSYNDNFRCRYAGIGMKYDENFDVFLNPQPYPSWNLNEKTFEWDAPIPKPELTQEQIDNLCYYMWNENNLNWELHP